MSIEYKIKWSNVRTQIDNSAFSEQTALSILKVWSIYKKVQLNLCIRSTPFKFVPNKYREEIYNFKT